MLSIGGWGVLILGAGDYCLLHVKGEGSNHAFEKNSEREHDGSSKANVSKRRILSNNDSNNDDLKSDLFSHAPPSPRSNDSPKVQHWGPLYPKPNAPGVFQVPKRWG